MISLSFMRLSSSDQMIEAVEQGLVAAGQLFDLTAQGGIPELGGCGLTLERQILGVAQRVLDIEQFFGTHVLSPRSQYARRGAVFAVKNLEFLQAGSSARGESMVQYRSMKRSGKERAKCM